MELLTQCFNDFEKTAKRIETLPLYNISLRNNIYNNYIKGNVIDDYSDKDWCEQIKKWTNQGKEIERVRVIPKKFNPYLSFEFACYEKNILAGEKISAIYEKDYKKICNKSGDIWIFDSNKILLLNYDNEGRYIKSELINNMECVETFEKLKKNSFEINKIYEKIRNQTFNLY